MLDQQHRRLARELADAARRARPCRPRRARRPARRAAAAAAARPARARARPASGRRRAGCPGSRSAASATPSSSSARQRERAQPPLGAVGAGERRAAREAARPRLALAPTITFSTAVSPANRPTPCSVRAMPEPGELVRAHPVAARSPSKRTLPASARTKPQMTLNSVVFPAPLGPMTPTTSPGATVSETSSSAVRPPKRTVRPSTSQHLRRFVAGGGALIVAVRQSSAARLCGRHNGRRRKERAMSVTLDVELREERRRILAVVDGHLDEVVETAVDAIRADIPVYGDAAGGAHRGRARAYRGALRDQGRAAWAPSRTSRSRTSRSRARAAMRRARAGLGLEDYINAFRVGQQVFWDARARRAGSDASGREAALTLATPLMRYCDFASTHAGHVFAESLQRAVADADRERRDLLEHLLAGELPAHGPLRAAAQGYGIARTRACWSSSPCRRARRPTPPRPAPRSPAPRSATPARSSSPARARSSRVAGARPRLRPRARCASASRPLARAPARGGPAAGASASALPAARRGRAPARLRRGTGARWSASATAAWSRAAR